MNASATAGTTLSPEEITDSLRAFSLLVNIKLLDRYWTQEAQRRTPGSGQSLAPAAEALIALLRELAEVLPRVAETSTRHADALQPRFEAMLARRPQRVRDIVNREAGVDISRSAEHISGLVLSRLDLEADSLRTEARRIDEGSASQGDISAHLDGCLDVLGLHVDVHVNVPSVETVLATIGAAVLAL